MKYLVADPIVDTTLGKLTIRVAISSNLQDYITEDYTLVPRFCKVSITGEDDDLFQISHPHVPNSIALEIDIQNINISKIKNHNRIDQIFLMLRNTHLIFQKFIFGVIIERNRFLHRMSSNLHMGFSKV